MAKAVVLAKERKLVGVFTKINLAWDAICKLEGTKQLEDHLILVDGCPSARKTVHSLNYAKLCAQLRDTRKADIRIDEGDSPAPIKYGIWLASLNEFFDDVKDEDVSEPVTVSEAEEESSEDDEYQNLAMFDHEVVKK